MPSSLARSGHNRHAPLTAPPDSPLGLHEREVLDTLAERGPLTFDALASILSDRKRATVDGILRGLRLVGEVAYDKDTHRWSRAA